MTDFLFSRRQMGLATAAFGLMAHQSGLAASLLSGKGQKLRVLVSSDIGGTDPDDFQSMVHLLVSADAIDLEGIVSSPWGPGRKRHILEVIDEYAKDFANLRTYSDGYPTPKKLREMAKQGAIDGANFRGYGDPTEGSQWIVECARKPDPRPLHLLVWGGIDDLAQALHDAPDILPRLRVYFIGGPNKKFSPDAYQYIAKNHSQLWIIEANTTYRGWFVGGNQTGKLENSAFVASGVNGKGALGRYFGQFLGGTMKMGDTPSLTWLTGPNPGDPRKGGWGGSFVRAWDRSHVIFDRHTTAQDRVEQFCVLEWRLSVAETRQAQPAGWLVIDNQTIPGFWDGSALCFRCSPRDPRAFSYTIRSNIKDLDGSGGAFTTYAPSPELARQPSQQWPNWWTDDPSPAFAEGDYQGAKTVSRWRKAFLDDFSARMDRCVAPARK